MIIIIIHFFGGWGGPPNCCALTIRICVSASMFFLPRHVSSGICPMDTQFCRRLVESIIYDERIPNKASLKRSCFGICFMALVHFWGAAGKYWEVGCVQCSWGEWRAELIDRICQSPLFRATHRSRESGVRRCWQIQIQKNTIGDGGSTAL